MAADLIVMLTWNDRTVHTAHEIFEECKGLPVQTWGFKDVGIGHDEMKRLAASMKEAGKTVFIENIEQDEDVILRCADLCIECGVDAMTGGKYFDSARDKLHRFGLRYEPTLGNLTGRPAVLKGSIIEIAREAEELGQKGVDGVCIASYRYSGNSVELMRAITKLGVPLCVAGSVDSFNRIDEVIACGVSSFTIGSAFFEHKFGDTFYRQINIVIDYLNSRLKQHLNN